MLAMLVAAAADPSGTGNLFPGLRYECAHVLQHPTYDRSYLHNVHARS